MNIRPATVADSESLARIQVDNYRLAYSDIFPPSHLAAFSYEEQERDWRDLLGAMDDVFFVAEMGRGELVGYALGRPGVDEVPPYDGELVALHVRLSSQGQGVGRELVKAMACAPQEQGCTSLLVWVLEKNSARIFYEKLGGQYLDLRKLVMEDVYEVAYGWAASESLCESAANRRGDS